MIRPNVAGITGLRLAGLFQGEAMTLVAGLAASNRAIDGRFSNTVTVLACKAGDIGPFLGSNDIALLIRGKLALRNRLVDRHELGR